jgi:hypothetical protein
MRNVMVAACLTAAAAALATAFTLAPPVHADPVWPQCVRPDGSPCPPPPPGCVQENGMPCSAAPQDLNAACARNPAICEWITHGGLGFSSHESRFEAPSPVLASPLVRASEQGYCYGSQVRDQQGQIYAPTASVRC